MATTAMEDYWSDVEYAVEDAHLIAFDGCHKIYLAMDEEQAQWFRDNYNGTDCDDRNFTGTPQQMLEKLKQWWDDSCGLRFIQAVATNHADPNAGFKSLIPQGASDVEDSWEDDEDEEY